MRVSQFYLFLHLRRKQLLELRQGATSDYSESGLEVKEKLQLDYLNLPVLAKYKFAPGWNLHLGPQIGFLLNAESEYEVSFVGETESDSEDLKDYVSSIDFGLSGGFGYELDMGVFFDARYYLGLSNINDSDEDFDSDYSIENNVIQLSVGYKF
ncbi:porin family protein [Christiangramia aestuarii]|uniref:PorT family protein n=1 Tax=Christiangramia aestuarii TaxID=1028746 RepID=A0A7K1LSS6_9FLAO|nr:porin family protein [Christiangramia aestuarii]MUP43828.1 PorT family protein [Christiangramia aestuarii]